MRKSLAWILGAISVLSMMPGISGASTQCPGAVRDSSMTLGVVPSTGYDPGPNVVISSGPAEAPANPANTTGLVDLGQYGCDYQATDGTVNTNWLTPGATVLKVSAYNYPSTDTPTVGCLKFNGTPSTLCTGTGEIVLRWTGSFVGLRACACWRSQTVTIPGAPQSTLPGGTLSVTVWAPLHPDKANPPSTIVKFYRTYTDVKAPI